MSDTEIAFYAAMRVITPPYLRLSTRLDRDSPMSDTYRVTFVTSGVVTGQDIYDATGGRR